MIKTTTQHDVVKFLYHETSTELSQVEVDIICNEGFAETYYQLKSTKDRMEKMMLAPSESCVNMILEFAKENSKVL